MVSPAMSTARVLWVILIVRVLPVMQWVMASLTMSVVRVLQALSREMAMWAASMAGVLWVMLRVVALLATLTTVRVRRCIGGVAGGVDGGGVVGDGECGGMGIGDAGVVDGEGDVSLALPVGRVLRVVPWVAESSVVPMVMVLPVASILRVLLPVAVGLACATGGVTVQVVVRPGAPS